MITIEKAIKHCEEVAEELRNVDMGELDALYCGDTECIEARKNDCIECADEHKQLAEWLEDYKRLKKQEPILDKIRAEIKGWQVDIHDNEYDADKHDFVFERIFEIIDEYKTESEG